jgi:uncharacterized membrane protein YgdD (TMEM256/DUF423 family)
MHAPSRRFCMLAALLLALATVLGALSAHVLRSRLAGDRLEVLQTAVHYQFFHALGLFGLGLLYDRMPRRLLWWAGVLVSAGVLLFSGSIYLLVAGAPRGLGVLTPLGGLALIAGWCVVALSLIGEARA